MLKVFKNPWLKYSLIVGVSILVLGSMGLAISQDKTEASSGNKNSKVDLSNSANWVIKGIDFRGDIDASNSIGIKLEDTHAENITALNSDQLNLNRNGVDGDVVVDVDKTNGEGINVNQNITDNIVGGSFSADVNITTTEGLVSTWFSMDNPVISLVILLLVAFLSWRFIGKTSERL